MAVLQQDPGTTLVWGQGMGRHAELHDQVCLPAGRSQRSF